VNFKKNVPITIIGQTYQGCNRLYNSIYPLQIKPYIPPQTKKTVKQEEDNNSSSHSSDFNKDRRAKAYETDTFTPTNPDGKRTLTRQEFPDGTKSAIDYSKSQVNIAQILTDFKNTALAIGSPQNILQEVEQYLSLAESESLKNEPNKKLIQSNLRNASSILDNFISVTLDKKSKVVENWVDALFLQQVNYKSDPTTINEDFLVKLPDKETGDMKPISPNLVQSKPEEQSEVLEEDIQEEIQQPKPYYIPTDEDIKQSLQKAKRIAFTNPIEAKELLMTTLEKAMSIGDTNAEGIASFELGKILDNQDELPEALMYYHQAFKSTNDNNLKAKSLYSMAKIYDDVVYFGPAMEHYFAAISYAGEAENLKAQTLILSEIGDLYSERYDIPNTYHYYSVAKNIADDTNDNKTKAFVWSRSGDALTVLNENVNALNDYKVSSQFYAQTDSSLKMAKNYEKASQIMQKLGNINKAKSLLETAQKIALNIDDIGYAQLLEQQLVLL